MQCSLGLTAVTYSVRGLTFYSVINLCMPVPLSCTDWLVAPMFYSLIGLLKCFFMLRSDLRVDVVLIDILVSDFTEEVEFIGRVFLPQHPLSFINGRK